MNEYLDKIADRLEEMYPNRSPMIEIFGDKSWSLEVDNTIHGRIGGEISGQDITELEIALDIKL